MVAVFSFILISIEEIILGIVTYLIWGDQDNSLFAEQEENSEKEIISQKEERENEEKKKSFRTIQELQKLIKKKSEMADYCM